MNRDEIVAYLNLSTIILMPIFLDDRFFSICKAIAIKNYFLQCSFAVTQKVDHLFS